MPGARVLGPCEYFLMILLLTLPRMLHYFQIENPNIFITRDVEFRQNFPASGIFYARYSIPCSKWG
jgi:hypothetical protein